MRHGPALASIAAALAALPGLWLPFLADDWTLLARAGAPLPRATVDRSLHPLYLATFWIDRTLWGLSPALFHLTNVALIALSAALVVAVVRRYARDPLLALAAGLLFALHPWHVESAAWVAARGEPLSACLLLLAILAYDRWREDGRGLPLLALAFFEAALLTQESAFILPFVLVVIGVLDRRHRLFPREALQGLLPVVLVAAFHVLWLSPWAASGIAQGPEEDRGPGGALRAVVVVAGTVLPAEAERLASRPALTAGLAVIVIGALVTLAWRRSGRPPALAGALGAVFLCAVAPAVVGFRESGLYLAVAASGTALASLLIRIRGRPARALAALLSAGWLLALGHQWLGWAEAAGAGRRLVDDLVQASLHPGIREIVVVGLPPRVRDRPIAEGDDLMAALALSGGRPVAVRTVAPAADGTISARIAPLPDGSRAVYAWVSGRLEPLLAETGPPPATGERARGAGR